MNLNNHLDAMDHVAIAVQKIQPVVDWYRDNFRCEVLHQDDTWAMLQFANIKLALVIPAQHPTHLGFFRPDAGDFGVLKPHRDGTMSVYLSDPAGNAVEFLKSE